jgi:type VII secretion integral membrane protein EccD
MCRLVVCGPARQIEVAVPAQVLLADLLPALLHHLGDDLAETGLVHGGWVLQRVGDGPLDEDSSPAALGLRDGDVVHLLPRSEQLPPVDFDDLIDGVATGAEARSGRWRPEMTGWAATGALALTLTVVLVALAIPGQAAVRALGAGAVAIGALAAAFGLTRAAGQRSSGMVFAVAAVAYAALAAAVLPSGTDGGAAGLSGAPAIFSGAVAAASAAALAALLVGWGGPLFAAVIAGSLLAALGSGLSAYGSVPAVEAAGVVAVAATVVLPAVPLLAFRLSGLRLAPLPTEPEHLQEEIDPEPAGPLLAASAAADRYMTGLYAGLGGTAGAALVIVGARSDGVGVALVATVALARLLATRPMNSAWHRLAAALPAAAGLAAVTLAQVSAASGAARPLVLGVLLLVAAPALVVAGRTLPGRRLTPYWGHLGDITQTAATIAMFPLLLTLLGVYGYARALGG